MAEEVAQQVKTLATQAWQPEFHSQKPRKKLDVVMHTWNTGSIPMVEGKVESGESSGSLGARKPGICSRAADTRSCFRF